LVAWRRYVAMANKVHSSPRQASLASAVGGTRDAVEQAIEFSKSLIRGRWKMLESKAAGSPPRWERAAAAARKRQKSGCSLDSQTRAVLGL